jgi:hypothetical protein
MLISWKISSQIDSGVLRNVEEKGETREYGIMAVEGHASGQAGQGRCGRRMRGRALARMWIYFSA